MTLVTLDEDRAIAYQLKQLQEREESEFGNLECANVWRLSTSWFIYSI